jgi:hypothetical protein
VETPHRSRKTHGNGIVPSALQGCKQAGCSRHSGKTRGVGAHPDRALDRLAASGAIFLSFEWRIMRKPLFS